MIEDAYQAAIRRLEKYQTEIKRLRGLLDQESKWRKRAEERLNIRNKLLKQLSEYEFGDIIPEYLFYEIDALTAGKEAISKKETTQK